METLNYTPELSKAKKELFDYMNRNHLSFYKDYRNHPIHGRKISLLLLKINKERDKIMEDYPMHDQDNNRKFLIFKTRKSIMKKVTKEKVKDAKKADKIVEKKVEKKAVEKKDAKNTEKKKVSRAVKYNYPLIDGREMSSAEKKKYRMEQRKLAAGETKPAKESKKTKKADKVEKTKKVDKKVKKTKKREED